jgi:hypothetical protein
VVFGTSHQTGTLNVRLPGDLEEVTLSDIDAIRFLATAEREGTALQHCAPFIREWITREAERS